MLRTTPAGLMIPLLIAVLTTASPAEAQTAPFGDVAIREAVTRHVRSSATVQNRRVRRPCDPERRALRGAAIGMVIGIVVAHRAMASNDGSIGFKDALAAGTYGAGLGTLLGFSTCRR